MSINTLNFASGQIEVSAERITFRSSIKDLKQTQSMERYNMGYINSEEFTYLGIRPTQVALRAMLTGIIMALIAIVADIEIISMLGVSLIVFGFVIFNLGIWVDGFLGTRMAYNICCYLLGNKLHKITINNNSGGEHIQFYINFKELDIAIGLEKFRIRQQVKTASTQPNDLNDIEKINDLYKKGILTEDEFNQKKKQILSL